MRGPVRRIVALGVLVLAAAAYLVPLPLQVLEPAGRLEVTGLVRVAGAPGTAGEVHVAVQRSLRPSPLQVVWALMASNQEVSGPARPVQVERAAVIGARAGLGMAGARSTAHDPIVRVDADHDGLDHPDAELAVALAAWLAVREDTPERTVVIGAVAEDGSVSLTGSVRSVAEAAKQVAPGLVLVPASHAEELRTAIDDPTVEVFGVSSVFEAVAAILERSQQS